MSSRYWRRGKKLNFFSHQLISIVFTIKIYGIVGVGKYFQQSIVYNVFRMSPRICLDFKYVILPANVVLSYVCTSIAYWDIFKVLVLRPLTNFCR